MGLFDSFKKRKNKETVSPDESLNELLEVFAEGIQKGGLSLDELPGGYGDFGLVATNPIPTCFATGSSQYLSQLRTADGKSVKFSRMGSFSAENFPDTPVDGYRIETASGEKLPNVYICMYHKRNSTKAPKGFYLNM